MEPFRYNDLEALSTALPTDIESRKEFGDFDGEARLIEQWLQKDISENLKAKLRVEREILKRLPSDYPYSFEEAYERAKTVIKDLTPEQFRELQDKGRIDWIYVNGKEHFIHSTAGTLRNDVEHAARKEKGGALRTETPESAPGNTFWQSLIDMKKNGSDSWRFRIRFTLRVDDDAFRPGKIKVYIPVVCACSYVSDIKILETSSDHYILADENAPQRTICYEEDIRENHDFFVEYEYTVKSVYHDLWTEEAVSANRAEMNKPYPAEEVKQEDLAEQQPHIRFTPFMKDLALKITEGCETPLEKARAIYEYITTQVTYSFVRSYFTIENLGEYAAMNRKGDCGLQALMFITLCRCLGIPARWESGNEFYEGDPGSHDWSMVYLAPFGWLYVDPSYGGGAFRSGDVWRQRHFFGNLDPFRLPSNPQFQKQLTPPMTYFRDDPYDNQAGEIEYEDGSLIGDQFTSTRKLTLSEHLS